MSRGLTETCRALGIEAEAEALEPDWDESAGSLPDGELEFLRPAFVQQGCAYCGLDGELVAAAVAAAAKIASDPELRLLAWHAVERLWRRREPLNGWPVLNSALGADAGLFYLLVLLAGLPQTRAVHRERGIPADVVRATMADALLHGDKHCRRYGRFGLAPSVAGGWLRRHFRGELYRLGRLQFIPSHAPQPPRVFRHRETGAVLALAPGDLEIRTDGWLNGAGGVEDAAAWTSSFTETEDAFEGHPIDAARAAARQEPVRLPKASWSQVFGPGDGVLEMHIPGGEPLDHAACGASLRQALEFFPRHFPEQSFRAFYCTSWLFDPQLEAYLPATSNLVRFLREFYLVPTTGDAWSAARFVFETDILPSTRPEEIDLSALPRRTTLERAIVDHIRAGKHWCRASAFILAEDASRWGEQAYRQSDRLAATCT